MKTLAIKIISIVGIVLVLVFFLNMLYEVANTKTVWAVPAICMIPVLSGIAGGFILVIGKKSF